MVAALTVLLVLLVLFMLLVLLNLVLGNVGSDSTKSGAANGSEETTTHELAAGKGTGSTTSEAGENSSLTVWSIGTRLALGGIVVLAIGSAGITVWWLLVMLRSLVSVIVGSSVCAVLAASVIVVVSVGSGLMRSTTIRRLLVWGASRVRVAGLATVGAVVVLRIGVLVLGAVVVVSARIRGAASVGEVVLRVVALWISTLGISTLRVTTLVVVGVRGVASTAAGVWHSGALSGILGRATVLGRVAAGAAEEVVGRHMRRRR